MKSITKIAVAAALAGLASAPAALSAQSEATAPTPNVLGIPDDVVIFGAERPNVRTATAIVNDYVITGTDIEQRVALVAAASESEVSDEERDRLRRQVLRNLIDETLQIQEAIKLEAGVTQSDIDGRYATLAQQNFSGPPSLMDEYLLRIGSSPASLKRQIQGEIAWQRALQRNVLPFVNVSEEEVREVLERLNEAKGTEEYRIGEIYLSATSENRATVLQTAQQIIEQLRQGGSFEAYARQYSEASTASVGGDTGFLRLGTLPQAMADAAQQMQPGQLVGPIDIPGGLVLMYLIDKRQVLTADPRDALLSLRQISIDFPEGIAQEDATAKVEEFNQFIENLRGCADAETARTVIGATVVTNDNIRARSLPEQLQNILLQLQVGQTTPPFGSITEGVRVLMLCGRDEPEQDTGPTFDSMMDSLEQDRISKRARRYLRDLRTDAYIEYN